VTPAGVRLQSDTLVLRVRSVLPRTRLRLGADDCPRALRHHAGMSAQPRKIMIAFDDSDAARRALDRAADLAGYGSTLTVVSVARDGGRYQAGPLDQAREQLVRRQVPATYLEPAAELVETARELDADLVVLGRRSRSLRRVVLGSVSAKVVRDAPCDVLVVR